MGQGVVVVKRIAVMLLLLSSALKASSLGGSQVHPALIDGRGGSNAHRRSA